MIYVVVKNVNQELNQPNVPLVKVPVLLILDKVQCKFRWVVILVMEKELLFLILALIVEELVLLIEHKKNK